MTNKYRRAEIVRFLKEKAPAVLCIRGKWGTGKTFAWSTYLREAVDRGELAGGTSSYVSLFGINSLTDLKSAIFENSVTGKSLGSEPTSETYAINLTQAFGRQSNKAFKGILGLLSLGSFSDLIAPAVFFAVRNQIVCIDDIERKGSGLSLGDVLGLCSYLKEHRNCKVALILNDAELKKEEEEFKTYFEKVIDVPIAFNPTPKECADLVLPIGTPMERRIHRCVIALRITNIRVIKRIQTLTTKVIEALGAREEKFIDETTMLIAVLSWIEFLSHEAPPLSFLQDRGVQKTAQFLANERDNETEEQKKAREREKRWHSILDDVGCGEIDSFGEGLLQGIRDGYFDTEALAALACTVQERMAASEKTLEYSSAWATLQGSLENNEEEMIDLIVEKSRSCIDVVSPLNLDATVRFLRKVGRMEEIRELIALFVAKHGGNPHVAHSVIARRHVEDPDVREALANVSRSAHDQRSINDVWGEIGTGRLSHENQDRLRDLTIEEIRDGLKGIRGVHALETALETCRGFQGKARNGEAFSANFHQALRLIAAESAVQAFRLRDYVTEETPDEEEPLTKV